MTIAKFVAHSKRTLEIAVKYGWQTGARYTNLRDVREFTNLGFLDIDWKNYDFDQHLFAAKRKKPYMTVARDIEKVDDLDTILTQANQLSKHAKVVVLVPKALELSESMEDVIPKQYMFGYSVPTRYGGTRIQPECFKRPVHLLGGRPDTQRRLAEKMNVASFDCNRFTFDAAYGDYFDGETFRPHPLGGYDRCLEDSIVNITALWDTYRANSDCEIAS